MYKKGLLYISIFLLFLSSVFASNALTLHYYDEDGNSVTNVEVSLFECTDEDCIALTGTSTSDRVDYDDTGSTNDATLTIPSQSSETYFIAYAFAEASDSYLPHATTFSLDGNGHTAETDVTLSKKDICRSVIQSFSVTNSVVENEPIYVDVEAALEADTYSAFMLNDDVYPWAYDSSETSGYQDWYSAETDVDLTITKQITIPGPFGENTFIIPVHSDSESLKILAEESENVQFSWTPTIAGTYTATVTTTVPDAQCATTEEQSSAEQFDVVDEEESEYCYTLIDNLAIQEIEDGTVSPDALQTGETYTVIFDKLSNSVDADGDLAALDTALDVSIYDDTGALDYAFTAIDGNSDTDYNEYSFSWTPVSEGDNTIVVYGIADNCPYSENTDETESLTLYVNGEDIEAEEYTPVAVADGSSLIGFTLSATPTYTVDFDGSGSYDTDPDGSGSIVSYAWDFGEGSTDTGVTPSHTFTGTGPFTVTLIVTDNDGLTASDTLTVRRFYLGLPSFDFDPNADCGGPYSATLGESISFDGTGSEFGGGAVTFAWDFGDGSTSTDEDPTYTYSAEGIYTVTLVVTDDEGDTDSCTTTATISAVVVNSAPEVDCSTVPTSGTTNEEVTLQVVATDSDGTVVEYNWDFGDGTIDSTLTDSTTHTYSTAGNYLLVVQVVDDAGETGNCNQTIEITDEEIVENEHPVADCSLIPTSAEVLEDITFDGSGSTDSDGTLANYEWDFGYLDPSGNSISVSGPTLSTTHLGYAEAGTYTVTLTVTDDAGATGSCSTDIEIVEEEISTEELAVTIVADTTSGTSPLDVCFRADVAGGTEPYSYSWDFETDGTVDSTDEAPCITYTSAGSFTVTLDITDAASETAADTETISVDEDLPAIAVASANPTSGEPTLWVQLYSTGSSGNEPLSYSWTFGDGQTSVLANPGHYYDEEGTYTATLTVTDTDGDTDSDSVTITVAEELENLGRNHYYIDGIALSNDGRVQAGDDLELWISAENIAGIDKDAVSFNAIIQELSIYEATEEFDLDADDAETKVLSIHIPKNTEPGTYYIRITVSDDDVHRIIYRDIIVTE